MPCVWRQLYFLVKNFYGCQWLIFTCLYFIFFWPRVYYIFVSIVRLYAILCDNSQGVFHMLQIVVSVNSLYVIILSWWCEFQQHWNGTVIGMITLVITGDVQGKLQCLQCWPGQSPWRSFHFCEWECCILVLRVSFQVNGFTLWIWDLRTSSLCKGISCDVKIIFLYWNNPWLPFCVTVHCWIW